MDRGDVRHRGTGRMDMHAAAAAAVFSGGFDGRREGVRMSQISGAAHVNGMNRELDGWHDRPRERSRSRDKYAEDWRRDFHHGVEEGIRDYRSYDPRDVSAYGGQWGRDFYGGEEQSYRASSQVAQFNDRNGATAHGDSRYLDGHRDKYHTDKDADGRRDKHYTDKDADVRRDKRHTDKDADGRRDKHHTDKDADGRRDKHHTDKDADGRRDKHHTDKDADGRRDKYHTDKDADGRRDKHHTDKDADGRRDKRHTDKDADDRRDEHISKRVKYDDYSRGAARSALLDKGQDIISSSRGASEVMHKGMIAGSGSQVAAAATAAVSQGIVATGGSGIAMERSSATAATTGGVAGIIDDVQYDEDDLRDIESFLEERDEEAERQRETQLAEERRKRRMEIEAKYHYASSESKPSAASNADPACEQLRPSAVTLAVAADGGSSGGWVETTGNSGVLSGEPADTEHAPTTSTSVPSASGKLAELHLADDDRDDDAALAQSEGMQLAVERSALQAEERLLSGAGKFAFDMFSASPSGIDDPAMLQPVGRRALREALLEGEDPHLQSNWDDGEGYYKARIGELVGDRFQILGVVGKGVFSTVLKCLDLRLGDGTQPVAIKMIRSNDTMRRAAEKEKAILLSIAEHDPQNKRFCVRLLTHLEYRNHVALVFEYQSMNLRETLKKFGKDVGINIGAIRMYGRQLFVALKHLMDLRIVHADLKLDNILCSGDLKQVKLCDFGSAFRETDTDNDPTPYLVSRFYRAPEIILGMPYDRAIDLWSVCVCLYELFTGHVMFPGRTNNEMLRLMMAVKGKFMNKQLRAHLRAYEVLSLEPHFDPDLRFRQYEMDQITGKAILRLIEVNNPSRDLATILRSCKAGADDMKLVTRLVDLLDRGLQLDPAKRLTVLDAFKHPFFASSATSHAKT